MHLSKDQVIPSIGWSKIELSGGQVISVLAFQIRILLKSPFFANMFLIGTKMAGSIKKNWTQSNAVEVWNEKLHLMFSMATCLNKGNYRTLPILGLLTLRPQPTPEWLGLWRPTSSSSCMFWRDLILAGLTWSVTASELIYAGNQSVISRVVVVESNPG